MIAAAGRRPQLASISRTAAFRTRRVAGGEADAPQTRRSAFWTNAVRAGRGMPSRDGARHKAQKWPEAARAGPLS